MPKWIVPVALLSVLLAGSALAQEGFGAYTVLNHDLPATVVPGQTVIAHLTWKILTPGEPAFRGPVMDFASTGPVKRGLRVQGHRLSPWSFDGEHKAGDLLRTTATLEVPIDFPPGLAAISLLLSRNGGEKGWQYANVVDAEGKTLGSVFRWPLTVKGPQSTSSASPLVIPTIPTPRIDGKADPAEWTGAASVTLAENLTGVAPKAATDVLVGHDGTNLYLAFKCAEPELARAVRTRYPGHDAPIWNNECVEVFLDPRGDRVSYSHFLVDLLNQRHDLLGSDSFGFNPAWQSAVSEGANQWVAEIAIPFSSLGTATPKPGQAWYGNFCRERKAVSELSAWKPTGGSFDAAGRFGLMVFDDLKLYLANQAAQLEPPANLAASLQDALAQWQQRRTAFQQQLQALDSAGAQASFAELSATLQGLDTDLRKLKSRSAALSGQGVLMTQASPYLGAVGAITPTETPAGPLSLQALAKETLDLAWDLTNPTDKPVTVRLTLRYGDPKAAASYLQLGLPGVTHQWRLATPVAAGDGRAVHDALVPLPAGTVTVPAGESVQVWLTLQAPRATDSVTGFVRVDRLDSAGAEPVILPLELQVLAQDIREPRAMHTFTWNVLLDPVRSDPAWLDAHLGNLAEHGVDVCAVSSLRNLPRVQAKEDGTLAEPLDFTQLDALLKAARPHFSIYYVNLDIWEKSWVRKDLFGLPFESPAYEVAFKTWFRQILDHLLASGLTYDQLLFCPYDESVGEACRKIAGWMKQVDSRARVVIDCSTPDVEEARKMDALTDVWVPHYRYHFAEDMGPFFELLREGRKPHWCYFYSEGGNDKAQDPTRHYLAKFWWAYAQGITGIGYWAQQYYGDPWYRADYKTSYDTSLVYPVEGGVVDSRRWEAWRRGWQDYQLLSLTEAKLKQAGDQAGVQELQRRLQEVVTVPGDPARAEATRRWLREKLATR